MNQELAAHRDFLNRYYGLSRPIYDLTRKYYLFGQNLTLEQLAGEPWTRLVEIGPGTGRNLRKLRAIRPEVTLGGIEACDEMLEWARRTCPWARIQQGFAENSDYRRLLGGRPDRVLFSYCLSMVGDQRGALENARRALAPGGEIVVVDFADLGTMARPIRCGMLSWLQTFRVDPLKPSLYEGIARRVEHGPGRYYVIARIPAGE